MLTEGVILTITLLSDLVVAGSKGDRSEVFLECLAKCSSTNKCPQFKSHFLWAIDPCFSCKYDCMWLTVKHFEEVLNEKIPQFYGKWPFIAIRLPFIHFLPVQELASVIFSLLNLYSSLTMFRAVRRLPHKSRMHYVWMLYSIIAIFVWIASSVFHWSDFWLTEWLDYSGACAVIVYAFFAAVSFTVPYLQQNKFGYFLWFALSAALLSFYCRHVADLWRHIDYGYNMRCCIVFSMATAFIYGMWMVVAWDRRTSRTSKHDTKSLPYLAVAVFGGMAAMLLEVFDFAPLWWFMDAHALFHLATAPLPLFLIKFIQKETEYEMKELKASSKRAKNE